MDFADKNHTDVTADVRDLITAYADGVFDIDPREIPAEGGYRAGGVIYPTDDGWQRATARAKKEHGLSAGRMTECILYMYARGRVRVERAVKITEVKKVHRNNLINSTGKSSGKMEQT